MTGHARAMDLAGAGPAFRLDPDEARELARHLAGCPECSVRASRLRLDATALGALDPAMSPRLHDRLREVAVTAPRPGPSALGIVLVFVLLGVAVVGASIGAGAFLAARPDAPAQPVLAAEAGDVVHWQTDGVALAAKSFSIEANGLTFTAPEGASVGGDRGDLERWTLEIEWQEHGVGQRLFLYFKSDGTSWWIDEVRTYDGAPPRAAEWARFPAGRLAQTPLGQAWAGDIDLAGSSPTGPVRLHLGGVRLAVRPTNPVNDPVGGQRIVLVENGDPASNGDPFGRGGPLHCSGILQQPPIAAEARLLALGYSLSWRWDYSTGSNTGYAEVRVTAPSTGWITDTAVGSHGELIVFVTDPARPTGQAIPAPDDCPTP